MAVITLLNGEKINTKIDLQKIKKLLHTEKKYIEIERSILLESFDGKTTTEIVLILVFIDKIIKIE